MEAENSTSSADLGTLNECIYMDHKLNEYYLYRCTIQKRGKDPLRLFTDVRRPDATAVSHFFQRYFSQEAVEAYANLFHLGGTVGNFLGKLLPKCELEQEWQSLRGALRLLRFLAHMGLDKAWLYPAYFFWQKHINSTTTCSHKEVDYCPQALADFRNGEQFSTLARTCAAQFQTSISIA